MEYTVIIHVWRQLVASEANVMNMMYRIANLVHVCLVNIFKDKQNITNWWGNYLNRVMAALNARESIM